MAKKKKSYKEIFADKKKKINKQIKNIYEAEGKARQKRLRKKSI